MGLRCLIGHEFGRSRTSEDRDDHGDEIVVTVQEYRECTRCGHRKVISENTEVTAKPTEDDEGEGADTASTVGGTPTSEYDDVTAAEDDGVILEGGGSRSEERGHGEWPTMDEDDVSTSESEPQAWPEADAVVDEESSTDPPEEWPEADAEDEGFDAEPDDGQAVEDVDFRGGLTPESTADPTLDEDLGDDDAVVEAAADGDDEFTRSTAERADDVAAGPTPSAPSAEGSDTGFTSAESAPVGAGEQRLSATETEVVCPECGQASPGESTSLRPGDICPECHRGYLTERARE